VTANNVRVAINDVTGDDVTKDVTGDDVTNDVTGDE